MARRAAPRTAAATLALLLGFVLGSVPMAAAQRAPEGPVPTVAGPVTGGQGKPSLITSAFDLGQFGYVQEEYLLSGTAQAYAAAGPLAGDGRWTVTPATTAPYTTRLVVYRPSDPKRFNGTVAVEWLNVSSGFDSAVGWGLSHLGLLREGMAWVGVSAQRVGVEGSPTAIVGAGGLRAADPARYSGLSHPGDSYSYDIFTQAGRAVRGDGAVGVLGPLRPKRLLATGESQSATRLVTYVNGVHPQAEVYDGFLIHSRFGGGAPLSQDPQPAVPVPVPARIRTDLRVPVLTFMTETDVGPLGGAAARQPDSRRFRWWEVAGTAHADAYTGGVGYNDLGDGSAEAKLLDYTNLSRGPLNCDTPVNAGPQYAVLIASLNHLDRWVRTGAPPPRGEPLTVTPGPGSTVGGQSVPSFVVARDEYGNAVGGIRTPFVDAPRAALTGELNVGGRFCNLFGTTRAFDTATVASLYPSRDAFLREWARATKRAVRAGFLEPPEAEKLAQAVEQVSYP